MIRCSEIIKHIETFAPKWLAADWDNVGLHVGDSQQQINRVLVSLDLNEEVIDEALKHQVQLIVTHHPLLFKPVQYITKQDIKGKLIYSLIQNNISCYCAHTNLDFANDGTNVALADKIGLFNSQVVDIYHREQLKKLVVFIPDGVHVENVRKAMCDAGAGWICKYSDCTFMGEGMGTFKPLEGTNPFIGETGVIEKTKEVRLETVVREDSLDDVVSAMLAAHPYEEVAYDIYTLENVGNIYGNGRIGELQNEMELDRFIDMVKLQLAIDNVRLIGSTDMVKRVAVTAGSYDQDLLKFIKGKADVIVCGDVKYHDAREIVDMGMCAIDVGHYASENVVVDVLVKYISKLGVDVIASQVDLNPFENK